VHRQQRCATVKSW